MCMYDILTHIYIYMYIYIYIHTYICITCMHTYYTCGPLALRALLFDASSNINIIYDIYIY